MTQEDAWDRKAPERDRFRSLIDAVVDYAIFAISPSGLVESWNSGAERIKGFTQDEIIGQHIARFYTDEDLAGDKPGHALRAAAEHGRFEEEAWRVRKDGTRFWAAVVIDAIREADGTLTGFAKVTRDCTARYELERTREQLHQAQKQELLGHLTAGLAHDFNNLLTAISGSFDLIAKFSDDERVERFVQAGLLAATRGQKLVSQLLAFARQQRLHAERSDVNELIAVLRQLLKSAVGSEITVVTQLDPGAPVIMLDQAQFQSALLNLIVNARDAMPRGGQLTITTGDRVVTEAGQALPPGRYVTVEVADTGAGMTDEVRARATEPFFSTKAPGAGSGLGLSQIHGFAAQSGGALEIESQPGLGTRVRLVLPQMEQPMDAAPAPRRRRGVLLVEDDPTVREVAQAMLSTMPYEVYVAADAAEALLLLQRDTPIDLLFTDIVMSGMNGAELAQRAIALRPNLRVLMASGHPRQFLEARHGVGGDVVVLQKPYRMAHLEQALSSVMPNESDYRSG